MIKSGEADIAYTISPSALKSLRKNSKLNVETLAIPRAVLIKVNSGSKFFNTPELRKAISLVIDRKAIAKAILKNEKLAATQIFPPSVKLWNNKDIKPLNKKP